MADEERGSLVAERGSPESDQHEKQWPGIDGAFGFVVPSYQMLAARFEAADSRIVSLMTIGMNLTIGAPIFARALRADISFSSRWFVAALIVFGALIVGGLLARVRGVLVLPNPALMYQRELSKPGWRFKADAIYFAGLNFASNAKAVNEKGNWSIGLTALLVIEVLLFIAWIAG